MANTVRSTPPSLGSAVWFVVLSALVGQVGKSRNALALRALCVVWLPTGLEQVPTDN